MAKAIDALDRRFYSDYVDEHARFDDSIRRCLRPGMNVLDAGAGRGIRYPYDYGRIASRVAGVDVDPAVLDNVNLTDAAVADLAALPYPNGEFDLVFSKYVFEHLEHPLPVLRELRRVMRLGAHLLVHTPNRWHYVAFSARIDSAPVPRVVQRTSRTRRSRHVPNLLSGQRCPYDPATRRQERV